MADMVWVAGQWRDDGPWEMQGIFTTEEKAVAACADDQQFVGPVVLDRIAPQETVAWEGAYYPKALEDHDG